MFHDLTNLVADFPETCIFKLFSPVLYKKTQMFVTGSILLIIIVSDVLKSHGEHPIITTLVFSKKRTHLFE